MASSSTSSPSSLSTSPGWVCGHCQKSRPRFLCTGCRSIRYCTPACRQDHWQTHKGACRISPSSSSPSLSASDSSPKASAPTPASASPPASSGASSCSTAPEVPRETEKKKEEAKVTAPDLFQFFWDSITSNHLMSTPAYAQRKEELDALLTPITVRRLFATHVTPELESQTTERVFVLQFASTQAIVRAIQGSPQPGDFLEAMTSATIADLRKSFPTSKQLAEEYTSDPSRIFVSVAHILPVGRMASELGLLRVGDHSPETERSRHAVTRVYHSLTTLLRSTTTIREDTSASRAV